MSDRSDAMTAEVVSEPTPPDRPKGRPAWAAVAEWVGLAVIAVLLAFLVQRFLFQAFYIPSRSMEPTLEVGDRVLVNKLSYRLHDVRRGDVVVFVAPEAQQTPDIDDFVKRVIALPGETIQFRGGRVLINGQELEEPYLPDEVQGLTVIDQPPPGCAQTTEQPDVSCTIPPGSVFVMGDNRTQSKDGRFFGPIPQDDVVGRVFLHVWPPTITWVYLAGVLLALVVAYLAVRALVRRRRRVPPSDHDDSNSPTTATIRATRSQ